MTNDDVQELRAFLSEADRTIAGLDSTAVRVWVERDQDGEIVGSTGYETSTDGADVLIRSVAVSSTRRAAGAGTRLARFALEEAARLGATRGSSHADRGPSGRSSDSVRQTGANSLPCCPARSKYASLPKPVSSSGKWRGCATSPLSAPRLAALPGRRPANGQRSQVESAPALLLRTPARRTTKKPIVAGVARSARLKNAPEAITRDRSGRVGSSPGRLTVRTTR